MDSYKKSRRKSIIAWIIAFVLAIGAAIVSFTPFIFMVLNSFKEKFEMLTKGVFQLPDQLNWSNYTEVLTGGFANYFKNSVIVLAISLILLLQHALLILWQDLSLKWHSRFMRLL